MKDYHQLTRVGQLRRLRKLARLALARYGLEHANLVLLKNVSTPILCIDTPTDAASTRRTRFVLRIHDPEKLSRDVLRSELQWLVALRRDIGVVVPEPLVNIDGDLLTEVTSDDVAGSRVIVVFHWVEGEIRNARLGTREFAAVGSFMARLHEHARSFQPPPGFTRPRLDWNWLFGPTAPLGSGRGKEVFSSQDMAVFQRTGEFIRQQMQQLGEGPEVFGLIHSDLHQFNYLFYCGEVRAIDFQDCGWGYYLYDMAPTFSEALERKNLTPQDWAAQRAAFLDGYQHVRALPGDYEEQLKIFELVRVVDLVNWVLSWPSIDLQQWGPDYLQLAVRVLKERLQDGCFL
ncbi:MAG TPA: phosphotransferase [Ktedonobacteraceae bacterium]|nr:phosphotransferase [Ktedonobacteraceae bacterium]